jgi:hypothetical protein
VPLIYQKPRYGLTQVLDLLYKKSKMPSFSPKML